jgi:hypothetical protein
VSADTITVNGTAAQRAKVAGWLHTGLGGAAVTIAADGKLTVGPGGNASATRLRNMATSATAVQIDLVEGKADVRLGRWNSNATGGTTGTQTVDLTDLDNLNNVLNSYGITPAFWLIHEITEVFEAKAHPTWKYPQAHKEAIKAENEYLTAHGVKNSFSGKPDRVLWKNGKVYIKVMRPPAAPLKSAVVEMDVSKAAMTHKWYKEKVVCDFSKGLTVIPDPDPFVHALEWNPDGPPTFSTPVATALDVLPQAASFDSDGNVIVLASSPGGPQLTAYDHDWNDLGTTRCRACPERLRACL